MAFTRYALVDDAGVVACKTHQDDEETPLEAPDLHGLIRIVADWLDVGESDVKEMVADGNVIDGDDEIGLTYRVVRFQIEVFDLNEEDLKQLDS